MSDFPYTMSVSLETVLFDDCGDLDDTLYEWIDSLENTFDNLFELCLFLKNNVSHASEYPLDPHSKAWFIGHNIEDREYYELGTIKSYHYFLNELSDKTRLRVNRFLIASKVCK